MLEAIKKSILELSFSPELLVIVSALGKSLSDTGSNFSSRFAESHSQRMFSTYSGSITRLVS